MAGDQAFTGLVTVLASALSSPGLLCCLSMSLRCAALLYLWLCAHSLLDHGIRGLLACPSPFSRPKFSLFRWVLFSPMVPNLRDGVTPAGSRLVCPRSERWFSVTIWVRCNGQFPGWASNLCLRLLFAPCLSGCVSRWSSLRT